MQNVERPSHVEPPQAERYAERHKVWALDVRGGSFQSEGPPRNFVNSRFCLHPPQSGCSIVGMNTATAAKVSDIKVGDSIYPPQREISLWMKKALAEKGQDESALILTVVEVRESKPDKNGPWTFVKAQYSREWTKNYEQPDKAQYMTFRARPGSPWRFA